MTQTPATPHRVIADRVRELRKGRGWSAQRLAEALAQVGIPWDRSVVANFENGRRASLSVEEFLALAFVLDVAPVHLLVPPAADASDPYQLTAQVTATAGGARLMVQGRWPLLGMDPWTYFREVPPGERIPDDELARMDSLAKRGMRPITPGDLPGTADGER